MGLRARSVANQSPGRAESAQGTYQTQLNQLTGKTVKKRASNSDDTVVYELLRRRGDEEAHHKGILETLDILYRGLDEAEAAELTAHLNQFGGMGNDILNLVNMPKDIHTGEEGIHPWAIAKGYQYHTKYEPKGFVRDMLDASELPLAYRKHVGERYLTEAVPAMKAKINELLQAHPTMNEKLDMSAVRKAAAAEELLSNKLNKLNSLMNDGKLSQSGKVNYLEPRESGPGDQIIVIAA